MPKLEGNMISSPSSADVFQDTSTIQDNEIMQLQNVSMLLN